ncbi:MAG: glycoside hydrolase family 3 C-terminal domain-containing protein [Oscillospiraceae bacterium]
MEKYLDHALTPQQRAEALADTLTVQEQAEQLKYNAPAIPKAGLPAYNWWNEGLHGVARAGTATMFPQAIGLAAMFDREQLRRCAEITAHEARAKYNAAQAHGDYDIYKGLTLWAPNINIFRDPRWGRGHETYGEDPYLTARLGVEYVRGLQGDGKYLKTAACAKHFAVHSGPEAERHTFDAEVTPKDLEETYLPAFKALVEEAHVESVMGAYNMVNGEPACASRFLMDKLREWGFDGYFTSDCWAIQDFHTNHCVTATAPESAAMALKAGCDMNCGSTYLHILAALEKGLVSPEDIRTACVHVLRTRIRLGQLDKTEFDDIPITDVSTEESKAVAEECALKSAVLLKNNGILPLSGDIGTLAVIGPNADSRAALTGNYNGTADSYVTFLDGIRERFSGRILYSEGCHLYKDRTQGLAQPGDLYSEALAMAEAADVVIACVGLDATLEGEEGDTGNEFSSGDKPDLRLPESQRILLEKLSALGKPLVIVLAAGSSVNVGVDCDALLDMWYPGQRGGRALAKLLFGDVSPSGKLPVTFYKTADLLPDMHDYSMTGRTYRYCDNSNVLYPFGYGLSYADIRCTELSVRLERAELTVTNHSDIPAGEVVQLYIKGYTTNDVPNWSLCGFQRVYLQPGESRRVSIDIPRSAYETVLDDGTRKSVWSCFKFFAGTSQPDEISRELTGKSCLSLEIIF